MKRYIVHSSKEVPFQKLVSCYGLSPDECLSIESISPILRTRTELIHLFPLSDGSYRETLERILRLREES